MPTTKARLLHGAEFCRYYAVCMRSHPGVGASPPAFRERRARQHSKLFAQAVLVSAVLSLAAAALTTARAADKAALILSADDREALGRVAYAEAGGQREEGLAAVAHAVLNRVASGQFGANVQGVLDAVLEGSLVHRTSSPDSWGWRDWGARARRAASARLACDFTVPGEIPSTSAISASLSCS